MLLLICLFVGIVVFFALAFGMYRIVKYDLGALIFLFGVIGVVLTIIFAGCTIVTIQAHISKEADEAKWKQAYESLYNQAYYNMYENDNDLGKKQLADQITEWNEDLEAYRAYKNSKWVSIMYPMDISDFNTIPTTLIERTVG